MKIVIDIPDEDYKFIKDLQFYHSGRRSGRTIERNVINGIKGGTPYEERPHGEWKRIIEEDNDVECPFCGFQEDGVYYNFCPSCGAKMTKETNNE